MAIDLGIYRTDDPRMARYDWIANAMDSHVPSDPLPYPRLPEVPRSVLLYRAPLPLSERSRLGPPGCHMVCCTSANVPLSPEEIPTWASPTDPRGLTAYLFYPISPSIWNAAIGLPGPCVAVGLGHEARPEDFPDFLEGLVFHICCARWRGSFEGYIAHHQEHWAHPARERDRLYGGMMPEEKVAVAKTLKIYECSFPTEEPPRRRAA